MINLECDLTKVEVKELMYEYIDCFRHDFGLFKNNNQRLQNKIAQELLSRGYKTIPNMFRPIDIKLYNL